MVTRDATRCCVSCILPCGALDVIRIVHVSGRVEEISGAVTAGDIMQAYPKHVLRKPPPSALLGGVEAPKVMTLPPNAELQRGKIYFLVPVALPAPEKARSDATATRRRRKKKGRESNVTATDETVLLNEMYLSEILSEKVSSYRDVRRGRAGMWRPHLDSVSEGSNDL